MKVEQALSILDRLGGRSIDEIQRFRKLAIALAISGKLGGDAAQISLDAWADTTTLSYLRTTLAELRVSSEKLPEYFRDVTRFVRLGAIANIEKGKTAITKAHPGPFPMVVTGAERKPCDHYDFEGPAAIIPLVSSTGHGRASINRLHYQEDQFALGTILAAVFPKDPNLFSARFLFEYLSTFTEELLVSQMTGTANVTLTVGRIADVPVPIVDPEVQGEVDEVMALCDRLEETHQTREATRDRFTIATLNRLTASDTDEQSFRGHARFALDMLPALTARPDQIKSLRQTILDLAVHGKLVEQDPEDEPASVLLEKFAEKKAELIKKGDIKTRKIRPRERAESMVFSVPNGWELTDIGSVALKITDGAHRTPTYVEDGVPFVSVKDFSNGTLNLNNTRRISPDEHKVLYQRCDPKRGDILFGRIGTLGKAVLVQTDVEFSLFVSVGLIRFDHETIQPEFFRLLLNSPFVEAEFDRIKVGGGTHTNKLNLADLHTVALPIPPLAEQYRISDKVNQLTNLCDRLEASLAAANTKRSRLLESLLAQALTPMDEDLEVA